MGSLKTWSIAAALFICAAPAEADSVSRWRDLVTEASSRFGVPSEWIERVIRAESAGRTMFEGRPITSRVGAMGLMQLMPGTWAEIRSALRLGSDPYDPRDNILAGTYYLRLMYDRFGYPGLFGAYNAGPARYAGALETGRSLPLETRDYLAFVTGSVAGSTQSQNLKQQSPLFIAVGRRAPTAPEHSPALFVTWNNIDEASSR